MGLYVIKGFKWMMLSLYTWIFPLDIDGYRKSAYLSESLE